MLVILHMWPNDKIKLFIFNRKYYRTMYILKRLLLIYMISICCTPTIINTCFHLSVKQNIYSLTRDIYICLCYFCGAEPHN